LQSKAATVGFDWPNLKPVLAKLKEELAELETEIASADAPRSNENAPVAEIAEEFGDLLFVVANVARHLRVDPEAALRAANTKFTRRFRAVESKLQQIGRTPAQSTLAEMDRIWDDVKREERSGNVGSSQD
jgi:ATP diphosphatase